jgi:hypothetical protein
MFVMAKPVERRKARELRQAGMPYKRIAARLGVSPGSVYAWTNDIQLTEEQKTANLRGPRGPLDPDRIRRAAASWSQRCRLKRLGFQNEGRERARQGDLLHQAGCMLYWAEGAKARNTAKLSNSDPHMVRLFRRFLTESLAVPVEKISVTLNVYTTNGMSIQEIERYWLDLLELPASAARKHTLNHMPTSSSGRAKNKLPYGVCSLRVCSSRVVQHIFGAIQEYAGFDEPRWVDGPSH